jgi:hypothetical protein
MIKNLKMKNKETHVHFFSLIYIYISFYLDVRMRVFLFGFVINVFAYN